MKITFRKILPRIIFIGVVYLTFSLIYTKFYFRKDLYEHSPIIEQIEKLPETCQVVYLAESSNAASPPSDVDKRRISEMLGDYFDGLNICKIDHGAFHAGNYRYILDNIPDSSDIETVIVTMNYRSFGAGWIYSSLETSLQKHMIFLHKRPPLINKIALAFRGYDIKTKKQWEDKMLKVWGKDKLEFPGGFKYDNIRSWDRNKWKEGIYDEIGNKDYKKTELACHYIKNFAFHIDTSSNKRIKDFDYMVKLAKKKGWNLCFNLMAENLEQAKELVEPELVWLMTQNRDLLVDYYSRKGVMVIDNFDNVCDSLFFERHWTTEHYSEEGRHIIARNLADSIKKIYPRNYISSSDGH